ncbi:MAG: DUF6752 domain-containing protein [Marmoricola sp.]
MANVKPDKLSLRTRVVRATAGPMVDDLIRRITELEAEVQENRNLSLRVAELVDVVAELVVPIASQDAERIQAAITRFENSL